MNARQKLNRANVNGSIVIATIAGFLMPAAGHVLEPGETVRHDGLNFRVERVERRRVISVRLEKPEEAEAGADETSNNGHSAA